ncbi:MAG TPA: hypothetical protein VJB14_17640 [Planctomycetota bacterium]|nr:hypothetical protein [Planctomycetota bacterium]
MVIPVNPSPIPQAVLDIQGAMRGTVGTPTDANRFVTDQDPRLDGVSSVVTVTEDYEATLDDEAIQCDATAASFIVTLPAAASATRKLYRVKKIEPVAAAKKVTIAVAGGGTIDHETTKVISKRDDALTLYSDGTVYRIV